jgi:predicted phosphoribosyltransferase
MSLQFGDRTCAGEILAGKLTRYTAHPAALVLALPRGGVPVAQAVAQRLGVPLDVFIVRKLGVPGHQELAMGAIASGGVCVMNEQIVASLQIPNSTIAAVRATEQLELERRERRYRPGRPELSVEGRVVILVDDGIATGATMRAAALALRERNAARIIIAAPVASPGIRGQLGDVADEVAVVLQPEDFHGVGQWYADFTQVTDAEVTAILGASASGRADKR